MEKNKSFSEIGESNIESAATPIQAGGNINPKAIRLFRKPPWKLRMTIEGDRSYLKVKIVCAAPLSHPSRYICFLDEKNEVIWTVDDVSVLDAESRRIIKEELDLRYMTAIIERINSLRIEFGVSYWDVQTHRGRREFVAQNVSENAQWISERRLLLLDVDGNRFEIPDLDMLDKKSRGFIGIVL